MLSEKFYRILKAHKAEDYTLQLQCRLHYVVIESLLGHFPKFPKSAVYFQWHCNQKTLSRELQLKNISIFLELLSGTKLVTEVSTGFLECRILVTLPKSYATTNAPPATLEALSVIGGRLDRLNCLQRTQIGQLELLKKIVAEVIFLRIFQNS